MSGLFEKLGGSDLKKTLREDSMTTQEVKRKLAAILSADVKGYSRLMGEDEEWTVRTLSAYRKIVKNLVQQYRGRVVDAPGDNVLAEFASVVDAVQCAVEIQQVLRAKNAVQPETRRMDFRIGINLGDVIEEGEQIYGDGVNIAARVEGLAEAGGICISGSAFEQIENKLPLRYDYLGEHEVKNIAKPVRVYRAQIESEAAARKPLEVASKEKMVFPLPDKPSIAVLPFVNMSDDPKQEFFSDGITEEIITALSKSPYLFVIARQSTFAYKGKPVRVKQVSEELGVRYVLEGSVRRSGEKVRITAQLIDAMTGYHLWAERYDRDLKEIFALQDEIALKILKTVHEKLQPADHARVLGKGARNVEAFLKAMEAREHFYRATKEDNALARNLYEEVIALDPEYAFAYAGLAFTHMADIWFGTSKSPMESLGRAIELGEKAIALDESEAGGHADLGFFYANTGQFDKAVAHAERALALDPNSFAVLHNSAAALAYSGKPEEAIPLLQKAIRLNPFPPAVSFYFLSVAYSMLGRFDEAVENAKKAVERDPENQHIYLCLAFTCIFAGREEEARAAAAEVLRINPAFSIEQYVRLRPHFNKSQIDRTIDALRKAGLK
jgi:adenylate cyclase